MKAKKSYGQHFLKEEPIAERTALALQRLSEYRDIVEVGPGMGMLTKYLLQIADHQLTAIEADADMVEYLNAHYPALKEHIIYKDFLQVDLAAHFPEQFALIGNFPYNISSQILFKALDNVERVPELVGMFQREVAERVAAPVDSAEYSILSVLVQAFYEPKILFYIKPGSFNPPPQVQSAVIRLNRRASLELGCRPETFRKLVKAGFGQRRKMLRNSLQAFFPKEALESDPIFQKRPQNLTVAEFAELARRVDEARG